MQLSAYYGDHADRPREPHKATDQQQGGVLTLVAPAVFREDQHREGQEAGVAAENHVAARYVVGRVNYQEERAPEGGRHCHLESLIFVASQAFLDKLLGALGGRVREGSHDYLYEDRSE